MKKHLVMVTGCLLLLSYIFSSCTPHFYQPKPIEPVLLRQPDQLKINSIADVNLTTFSVAYSPQKGLGIQIGLGANDNKSVGSNNSGGTVTYLDEHYFNPYTAAGFYKSLADNFLFEMYGGIGMYYYKNNAISYLKQMNAVNLFLQPSIAFVHNNFDAAFTLRVDNLNRAKTIIKDSVLSPDDKKKYEFLNYKSYLFVQPAITLRAGFKYVKFQFQISKSIPFSSNYSSIYGYGSRSLFDPFEERNRVVFGVGITGEINNIFKRKQ